MAVDADVFSRLVPNEKPPESQDTLQIPKPQEKVSGWKYTGEVMKKAVADNAEMVNAGLRSWMNIMDPSLMFTQDYPSFLKRGLPEKTIVDKKVLESPTDPLAKQMEPMVRGATSMLSLPFAPGGGMVMAPVKAMVVGAGAGEGGEIGKFIFGNLGEMVGGETGRSIGAPMGEIAGSMAGGNANLIRMNAVGKAVTVPYNAATTAAQATKSVVAAKKAGDERSATSIFLDHYQTLKSKSMGMLEEHAADKVASTIARDPLWQASNQKTMEDTRITGVDPNVFSISQLTGNKTMAEIEAARNLTPQQATEALTRKEAQPRAIQDAFRRIVSRALPTDAKSLTEGLEAYRLGTVAKAQSIDDAAKKTREGVTNWTNNQMAESGANLRSLYDEQKGIALQNFNQRYNGVYEQVGPQMYDIRPVLQDTKAILSPLLAKVDTEVVPDSIRKLHALLLRNQRAKTAAQEALENRPFYMKNEPGPEVKDSTFTFPELHDLSSALSADAHTAFVNKNTDVGKALNRINEALQTQMEKQTPKPIWDQFQQVQRDYATRFVPRFREGVNYNLDREATSTNRGRERVSDEQIWGKYLSKGDMVDRMEQFDNLFSGRLGPKVPAAYKGLGEAVQNAYQREVIRPGFSEERHNRFLQEYDAALDRIPEVRGKLGHVAGSLDQLEKNKSLVIDNYKAITGQDGKSSDKVLSLQIGPPQAQQLFIQTMSDPLKMDAALKSPLANTPEKAQSFLKQAMLYADPWKQPGSLKTLLNMGQTIPGEPGTVGKLFQAAMGKEAGMLHEKRLRAIDDLIGVEQMTDAQHLRFESQSKGPMQEATGSSGASLLSGARSMSLGYGGPVYFPLITAGRFFNNKVAKATQQAMEEALYNPDKAAHILELARAKTNSPASVSAFRGIYGSGAFANEFLKELIDHGLVRANTSRSGMYGLQEAIKDKDEHGSSAERDRKRQDRLRAFQP